MRKIVVLLVLSLLAGKSFALGGLGHQLVCQLSYNNLTAETRSKVDALLAALPPKQQQLINKYTHQPEDHAISFGQACTWADAIKKDSSFDKFKSWHYMNVARNVSHIDEQSCLHDCLIAAIKFHSEQLKNSKNGWKRAKALMFLGHWLGDIHQPLHISFASDLGGNKTPVASTDGRCSNLHWLWDECLLTRSGMDEQQFLQQLQQQWQQAPIAKWQNSNAVQWADESFQLARAQDVGYCHMQDDSCQVNTSPAFASDYQQHFFPVIEQRVLQASVRLAGLLEQLL